MNIERLQIEGGFLDGFDIKFASGLNVLIGARGTGKTSVIELIRFALGGPIRAEESPGDFSSPSSLFLLCSSGEAVAVSLAVLGFKK